MACMRDKWQMQLALFIAVAAAAFLMSGPLAWGQAPALQNGGQPRSDIRSLKPSKKLDRSLQGGEKQVYEIRARKGSFIHTVVLQQGIDVVLALYSPDGKKIGIMDSPNGNFGPEQISTIAEASGLYRLEVASLDKTAPVGRYSVTVELKKSPCDQDRARINAEQAFAEAAQLAGQGNADSLKNAIKKYLVSLPLWHTAGDRYEEALTQRCIGEGYSAIGQNQKALEFFNQALPIWHETGDRGGEAQTLNDIGVVYYISGQNQKALEFYNQALSIQHEVGNRSSEAEILSNIGVVYSNLGQNQEALESYMQALPIAREVGARSTEAEILSNIGRVYFNLGQMEKPLGFYSQALSIRRELSDRRGEADVLSDIGTVYFRLGQSKEALEYLNQGLLARREVGDRLGEARSLQNIGVVSSALGQNQKALESYIQALPIERDVGDRPTEAIILTNIGRLYLILDQQQKALEYFNQALPIGREVGDRPIEAKTLNNIGWAYAKLGQQQKALEYLNQALPIERNVGDKVFEAFTLRNIGLVYYDLGQKQKALEFYNRALLIQREMRAPLDEGYSLHSIGKATADLGDSTGALRNEMAALSLAKAVGDPDLQGAVDDSLMRYFRDQNRPEVAILFGMDAVNSYQQMRQNIFGLDKEIQTGFAQSKSATYRELAELLVQADRLGEAEQVLDLLKEQELKEVVRGASPDAAAKLEPLRLTAAQQSAQGDLAVPEKAAVAVTDLSVEYATLLAKPARTPAEEDRLKVLDAQIEAGNGEVSAFFRNTVYPELAQKVGAQDANALLSKEKSEVSRLQNTLAELGPRVMGIRLLLGDEHAYAILVTAHTREKFELKATPAELRSKVLQVRDDLRSPSSDSKPHLEELYAMVVAPLEVELNALERRSESNSGTVPTLLWSLDDVLRYLPMSALYDGRRYMVERFNNVLFTPESYGHMAAPPAPSASELRVLAMGLSRSYGGLPALPGVLPELDAVVHDPAVPESHGPLNGILLPNERFTYEALKSELGGGTAYPVVHIASHFVLEEGGGSEPYLMLGGESTGVPEGYPLTLSKLEDSSISFRGTRLLTLSACSTAKSDTAKNGMEMDSLGMVAQQKDAEAVLATLWDVSDASTSQLMSDFYSRWVKNQMQGKAEALRQAQLAFLRGPSAQATAGGDRGFKTVQPATAAPVAPGYSHPFYWAPFVLIGNYQ